MLKWLKFFKEKKEMVQYGLQMQIGTPQWSVQDDVAYIEETHEKLVWVYACVTMISTCVSSVPWKLYKKGSKLVEIDNHPLLDLFNVQINPDFSSSDLFELWSTYLALQGKFYLMYDNPVLPQQLQILYPHYMQPIPSKEPGKLVDFFSYNRMSDEKRYSENLILWDRNIDPLDFYQGLSAIRALARTIDTENSAVDWNKSTLDNAGIPAGAIGMSNPSQTTIEEVRKKWKDKYTGAKNARIPLVLDTDRLSYIPFAISQLDMDFLNQRKLSRVEICSGFGTPGQVVGDPEGQTYANYEEALVSFWNNTVIPRYLNKIRSSINKNIVKKWDKNFYIDYDISKVEVLQENEDAKTNRIVIQFTSNLITLNEARIDLGRDEDKEFGDKYNFELAQVVADSISEVDENPDVDEDGVEDEMGGNGSNED